MEITSDKRDVFVETSALYALYKPDDPHHPRAVQISEDLTKSQIPLVTSNIMITETLTITSIRRGKEKAIVLGKIIKSIPLQIVFIDQILHEEAWKIFQKIKQKDVSFFDCTSFAVMEKIRIKTAFTFDDDFVRYGWNVLS